MQGRDDASNKADPSRTLAYPPEPEVEMATRESIERRLDQLEDALTWHRRRQARADALRAGFWASVPMAMIALWWGLRNQFLSLPDLNDRVIRSFTSGLRSDILLTFLLLWTVTRIGAGIIDRESGAMVQQYAEERIVLRAKLRSMPRARGDHDD